MDNLAPEGSGEPGNPNVATAPTPTNGSNGAEPVSFLSGLQDEGNRKVVEAKGWRDADTAIRSYTELEKRLTDVTSKTLTPPAADAKAEEWDAFYAKLGRPEKPDGYEFTLPEGLPENLPYDAEKATRYKQWSHQAGLTPRQAQVVHDLAAKEAAADFTKAQEALVARGEGANAEIVKAWGPKGSDSYVQNLQFADRFIKQNGGEALLNEMKSNGLLSTDGVVLSPMLAQAMSKAGKALYAEDHFATGTPTSAPRDPATTLYPTDPFKR